MTVIGMLDYLRKGGAKACISLAASSALSKQLLRLCNQEGIQVINVVRGDDKVKDLQENYGAKYVVNQSSAKFMEDIQKMIDEVQPTYLFECLGGDLCGDIFQLMPFKSVMVTYGNLTKTRISFDAQDLHWKDRKIIGFVLFNWLPTLT